VEEPSNGLRANLEAMLANSQDHSPNAKLWMRRVDTIQQRAKIELLGAGLDRLVVAATAMKIQEFALATDRQLRTRSDEFATHLK
jgi:hypothetical protein